MGFCSLVSGVQHWGTYGAGELRYPAQRIAEVKVALFPRQLSNEERELLQSRSL